MIDQPRATRIGLRSALAAAALRPPPPPPTARPTLSSMPIAGDLREFGKVLRRWALQEQTGGADARYGVGYRARSDIVDLWRHILAIR